MPIIFGPNITGSLQVQGAMFLKADGCFSYGENYSALAYGSQTGTSREAIFSASGSSSIYRDIETVQTSSNQNLIIIKF